MTWQQRLLNTVTRAKSANATRPTASDRKSGEQWPHVTSQDLYNIQMAFLRNHGFGAQRVERGPDLDPMIRVRSPTNDAVMIMEVSPDGLNWEIAGSDGNHLVEPISTNCADLADRIVDAVRRSH